MSLWLCIRLPRLALECLADDFERPAVVLERQRVICVNDSAATMGIRPGLDRATAEALAGDHGIAVYERDRARERSTLEQLQCWAYGTTPTLECWQGNALQLEIGGCLRLHGGDSQHPIEGLEHSLKQRGLLPAFGLAPNRIAAWLLSHRSDALATDGGQSIRERLAPLPIRLIPDDAAKNTGEIIAGLQRAGIDRFRALFTLPTRALRRRCGTAFGDWLESALATNDSVTRDFQPPARFSDALWFGFDIRNTSELEPAMARLLDQFCRFLRNTQLRSERIEWRLLRHRDEAQCFVVNCSEAHGDPNRWLELSRLHAERLTIPDNIEGLALSAEDLVEANATPGDLFDPQNPGESAGDLLDRLRSRLGLQAIQQLALRDAHLPEYCQYPTRQSPDSGGDTSDASPGPRLRPFWLIAEPLPVRQIDDRLLWQGALELVCGPERIEDNWWQRPVSRDYYIARRTDGELLWLYQDRHNSHWYVQGILS